MPHLSFINKTEAKGTYTENNDISLQKTIYPPQLIISQLNENQKYISNSNYETQQCLSYLQASLFATILEDTITEMRILVECNYEMRIEKTMSDMALLLALKFQVPHPDVTDELEGINPKDLENSVYKLKKLDNDRMRKELNKQLRQQRNHVKTVIYDTDAAIEELNIKVEDASLNSEIRSRYVERWQVARTEQHLQVIHDDESVPSTVIEYYKHRADSEQRVHTEVELLCNISINETLEKVENWMVKYDKDMEEIDLKIQIKKNDYQDMLDKRINYEETIEKHDTMMKEWNRFKAEREKARLYREKMTKSAIMVQAWWRGLLVRRQLGPYKVAKKKGAGAAKKK